MLVSFQVEEVDGLSFSDSEDEDDDDIADEFVSRLSCDGLCCNARACEP